MSVNECRDIAVTRPVISGQREQSRTYPRMTMGRRKEEEEQGDKGGRERHTQRDRDTHRERERHTQRERHTHSNIERSNMLVFQKYVL